MSLYDLIVRNGTIVTASGLRQVDIAIADRRIVALAPAIEGTCRDAIDAVGLHIFPGMIDVHVHLHEPGGTSREGFAIGSAALAAGGATTFFDMPFESSPPILDAAGFREQLAAAQSASLVDFGLWGRLTSSNLDRLDELAGCGVIGFNAFMSSSGNDDLPAVDDDTLYRGMSLAAQRGCLVAVHAEHEQITSFLTRRLRHMGQASVRDYLNSRPVIAELAAIERAIQIAAETGCSLHIARISTGHGVRLVAAARMRRIDVTCSTCPHYLIFTEEDLEELGAALKCAPPLRSREDQAALWQQLFVGNIPMIASDHTPLTPDRRIGDNFLQIQGGIAGGQSALQLMLTEGHMRRGLPLARVVSLTAEYTARRFSIAAHKGSISVGAHADLIFIDLQHSDVLHSHDLLYRHQHSPYIGMKLQSRVVRTLVRGSTVFLNKQIVSPPIGQLIQPNTHRYSQTAIPAPKQSYKARSSYMTHLSPTNVIA